MFLSRHADGSSDRDVQRCAGAAEQLARPAIGALGQYLYQVLTQKRLLCYTLIQCIT
jgi:hypothetical protein